MGTGSSCPAGFDRRIANTCAARCPSDFKYTMAGFGGRCIYREDNAVSVDLQLIPGLQRGEPETAAYTEERARVQAEVLAARTRVSTNNATRTQFQIEGANRTAQGADYSRIQKEYANYASTGSALKTIKEVNNSLTPFRPPTSPASDIEKERKAILSISDRNLLVIQIALFVVVVVLLVYVIIPGTLAHTVAFAVIVCGIASGFFLRT